MGAREHDASDAMVELYDGGISFRVTPDNRIYVVDVFAREKYAGNQLAVVLDASSLTADEMQRITRETNFSEAAFVESEGRGRVIPTMEGRLV